MSMLSIHDFLVSCIRRESQEVREHPELFALQMARMDGGIPEKTQTEPSLCREPLHSGKEFGLDPGQQVLTEGFTCCKRSDM